MAKERMVSVPESALRKAWQLIYTRDWPFSMMEDLAEVKSKFVTAIEGSINDGARPDTD